MEINPTPITLFCGMGGHARSVFIFFKYYTVQRIYIIYSKSNIFEYEQKIALIKQEIDQQIQSMIIKPSIYYIQINERDILQSFSQIAHLYMANLHRNIITDLTAGHKIISYLLFYAHSLLKIHHQHDSRLIYLWSETDDPIDLPELPIVALNSKEHDFLTQLEIYHQDHGIYFDAEKNKKREYSIYDYCEHISSLHMTKGTTHRYLKFLQQKGFLDEKYQLTIKTIFYQKMYCEYDDQINGDQ